MKTLLKAHGNFKVIWEILEFDNLFIKCWSLDYIPLSRILQRDIQKIMKTFDLSCMCWLAGN